MHQNNYNNNRAWSDYFMPDVNEILMGMPAWLFMDKISTATKFQDMREATDLRAFDARGRNIGVRLRRVDTADRFNWSLTIRTKNRHNTETEIDKIISGYGDYLFYGQVSNNAICHWHLMDLDVFRRCWGAVKKPAHYPEYKNMDGTAFIGIRTDHRTWPADILAATSMQSEYNTIKNNQRAWQQAQQQSAEQQDLF